MKPFSSLFAKIIFWFFLNLALVIGVMAVFFSLQSQVDIYSLLGRQTLDRMRIAGTLISHDLSRESRQNWSDILTRHGELNKVDFILSLEFDGQYRSKTINIPDSVVAKVIESFRMKPPDNGQSKAPMPFSPTPGSHEQRIPPLPKHTFEKDDYDNHQPDPDAKHRYIMRTKNPTLYWVGMPIPIHSDTLPPAMPAMLLAVSDSITGNGFFFDPIPWVIVVVCVIIISFLFWAPFVQNITRSLGRMTHAAEEVASGRFNVQIQERRSDEIGRLGRAINHMTSRLKGYVSSQKRFLRDIAHELASPIARIQLGLGILEQYTDPKNKERIFDVIEDVTHMSNLVNELLSFSRAEMDSKRVRHERISLLPVIQHAVQRESTPEVELVIKVDHDTNVFADPELLTRAFANIIRNAVKYAGDAGPIHIEARREKDNVIIKVMDSGPGVPEDFIDNIFEPFFRPEPSRDRDSGGVGLGLAIVKTCIDACNGSVSATNLQPNGLMITIILKS